MSDDKTLCLNFANLHTFSESRWLEKKRSRGIHRAYCFVGQWKINEKDNTGHKALFRLGSYS